MFTEDQLRKTFLRVGLEYDPSAARDEALLARIQYAFQKTVPYENLDILFGVPLSLEPDALYDKIVTRRRGGYCFELNGFLGMVLRSAGFPVTDYMARFLRGEASIPMRRHRVLAVTAADGCRYLCDAGIGQSAFRLPLAMREGFVSEQYGEIYKVEKAPFFGWVISDLHKGEWRRFYSFTEEEQLNIDYVMPSYWCEHAPESPFTDHAILSIKTDTGRVTLDGNAFRIFDGDSVTETILEGDALRSACRTYFGLDFDGRTLAE